MSTTNSRRVRLSGFPKEMRERYGIGKTVEAEVDESATGGGFSFTNDAGQPVSVDAVELSGADIKVTYL